MIDFTTETERKRCKQIDKCQDLLSDVTDALGFGIDTRKATNKLIKLRNYLNKELPDKKLRPLLTRSARRMKRCLTLLFASATGAHKTLPNAVLRATTRRPSADCAIYAGRMWQLRASSRSTVAPYERQGMEEVVQEAEAIQGRHPRRKG